MYTPGIQDLHYNAEKLFPRLDDLIDIHMTFLRNLQDLQNQKVGDSVEEIGPTLVDQVKKTTQVWSLYRISTSS